VHHRSFLRSDMSAPSRRRVNYAGSVTRPVLQVTKIIVAAAVGSCPPTAYEIRSALVWISEEDSRERGKKDVRDAEDG